MPILFAVLLLAQTLTVTVKPATPFTITWDQPPVPDAQGVNYRWWCDGNIVKNFGALEPVATVPVNADGTTTYTATVPGLPAGAHTCQVSAYNPVGESKGEAIPVSVGTLPGTPLRLRIVVTVGGGA